jgi:hypothetical protein
LSSPLAVRSRPPAYLIFWTFYLCLCDSSSLVWWHWLLNKMFARSWKCDICGACDLWNWLLNEL